MLDVQESKRSGLIVAGGPHGFVGMGQLPRARVRIYVESGVVVFAEGGTIEETLGRMLVRERVISEDQYEAAIDWMTDIRSRGKKNKLGEVLVELGILVPGQVNAALAAQVQQKVVRALSWPSTTVSVMECDAPLVLLGRFATPIEPLLVAALRLADREKVEDLLVQIRERCPRLRPDSIAQLQACRLRPEEEKLARALDGSRSTTELMELRPIEVDAPLVVAVLLLLDALALDRTRPAVPRPRVSKAPDEPPTPSLRMRRARRSRYEAAHRIVATLRDAKAA